MSKPITLAEIKRKAEGTLVDIPDWENPNDTIAVRLRRIDITKKVISGGLLPNDLKGLADKVFDGVDMEQIGEEFKDQVFAGNDMAEKLEGFTGMLDALCDEAMLEPKFAEVQEVYPLTLPQKMAIFNWLMGDTGVRALEPFCDKSGADDRDVDDG